MCGRRFERKLEPAFQVTPWIAEFYNTLSNLPFLLIGLWRYNELALLDETVLVEQLRFLYALYIACGVCSAIHHATTPRWTILIDWIPISTSILLILKFHFVVYFGVVSWFKLGLAMAMLVNDHVYTTVNVPWGHCFWHVLAAFSIDACYQDALSSTA